MTKAPIPPEVEAALAQGNKIEAIKRLREATGLGLKEAKDWIDGYERGRVPAPLPQFDHPPERNPNATINITPGALEALKRGSVIEAIKNIRDSTGVGLAEAKSIAEEIQRSIPKDPFWKAHHRASSPSTQRLAPGEVAQGSGAGKWVALIAIAIVAIGAAIYFR